MGFLGLQEGCVFYVFNKCNKIKKKEKLHNLRNNNFFLQNELTNTRHITNINNYKRYYYVCDNSSLLKITEICDDTVCISSTKRIKKDNNILITFEALELTNFKHYLRTLKNPTTYVYTIVDFYRRLLFSIHLMVKNKLVHNNINFDSIVVNNHLPLFSEFLFSINISHVDLKPYIKSFFITYDPTFVEWPIEIHMLSYLISHNLNSLSFSNIENIIDNVTKYNELLKSFGDSFVSSYKEEALQYFNKYVNQSYDYILTDVLLYYDTWDNYALSILFLRILIGIHRTSGIKNKFIILFMKLLVGNIHLNPLKRLSVSATTIRFESLLDNIEPKDYKEVINNLCLR